MSKLIGGRERPRAPGPPACPEWARTLFFTGDVPAEDSPDHSTYVATFFEKGSLEELWRTHRAALIREWVRTRPGTRPPWWWSHDAPEMRRFVPGQHIVASASEYFLGTGVPLAFPEAEGELLFEGTARVESEAGYLRRLELFELGEQGRVKRAAYSPETFDFTIPEADGGAAA